MDGVSAASAVASLVILGGKLTVQAHGFFGKVKDCPKRVKNIETDLKSTTNILGQLEKAFGNPANSGLFSLEERRNDFQGTIDGVGEIFTELTDLIKKYDGLRLWKKGKWALTGLDEATHLGRLLSTQKQNLALILQLTQSEALSSIRHGVGNIHHGVVDIRHGVGDNSDDLRVVMSQLHVLRMNGTGVSDPRFGGWIESAATCADTASLAGTVPQSFYGGESPTTSRSSSDMTERAAHSTELTLLSEPAHFPDPSSYLHLSSVVYRCTEYLRYTASEKWLTIPFRTYPEYLNSQALDNLSDYKLSIKQLSRQAIMALKQTQIRVDYQEESALARLPTLTADVPDVKELQGRRKDGFTTQDSLHLLGDCVTCFKDLIEIVWAVDRGNESYGTFSESMRMLLQCEDRIADYVSAWRRRSKYDASAAFCYQSGLPILFGNKRTKKGAEMHDIGAILWRRFEDDGDVNLMSLDWRQSGRHSLNCVGDLFIQYLLEEEAPIIPSSVEETIMERCSYGEWYGYHLDRHYLGDRKYLLLYQLLRFLSDIARLAVDAEDGIEHLAQTFGPIIGVSHRCVILLIHQYHDVLLPPYQDSDKNTFSFEAPFPEQPLDPVPPHLRFAIQCIHQPIDWEGFVLCVELPTPYWTRPQLPRRGDGFAY